QHRDGRHRADAGQNADQRADQGAEQAVGEVLPREDDREAETQMVDQFHGMIQSRKGSPSTTTNSSTLPPTRATVRIAASRSRNSAPAKAAAASIASEAGTSPARSTSTPNSVTASTIISSGRRRPTSSFSPGTSSERTSRAVPSPAIR